jgi:hypothetical protein
MSNYSGDLTWETWANSLTSSANTVLNDINQAYEWYQKWSTLTYGLTDAQIQALPWCSDSRKQRRVSDSLSIIIRGGFKWLRTK